MTLSMRTEELHLAFAEPFHIARFAQAPAA